MSTWTAPASTVRVSLPMFKKRFIFILIRVPPSATPHGAVEWFDPTARTGDGYLSGFFKTEMMSSGEFASTIACGCETKSPNQFVTVRSDTVASSFDECLHSARAARIPDFGGFHRENRPIIVPLRAVRRNDFA